MENDESNNDWLSLLEQVGSHGEVCLPLETIPSATISSSSSSSSSTEASHTKLAFEEYSFAFEAEESLGKTEALEEGLEQGMDQRLSLFETIYENLNYSITDSSTYRNRNNKGLLDGTVLNDEEVVPGTSSSMCSNSSFCAEDKVISIAIDRENKNCKTNFSPQGTDS